MIVHSEIYIPMILITAALAVFGTILIAARIRILTLASFIFLSLASTLTGILHYLSYSTIQFDTWRYVPPIIDGNHASIGILLCPLFIIIMFFTILSFLNYCVESINYEFDFKSVVVDLSAFTWAYCFLYFLPCIMEEYSLLSGYGVVDYALSDMLEFTTCCIKWLVVAMFLTKTFNILMNDERFKTDVKKVNVYINDKLK